MTDCEYSTSVLERSLGLLDAAKAPGVEAHMVSCEVCQGFARAAAGCVPALALPDEKPAAGGWDRLAERIELDRRRQDVRVSVGCSYCHGALAREEAVYCAACLAPHHGDCFSEHGHCSALGCGETRFVESRVAAPSRAAGARAGRGRGLLLVSLGLVVGVGSAAALLPTATVTPPVPTPTDRVQKAPRAPETLETRTILPPQELTPPGSVGAGETLFVQSGSDYGAIAFEYALVWSGVRQTHYRTYLYDSGGALLSSTPGILTGGDGAWVEFGRFRLWLGSTDGGFVVLGERGEGFCRTQASPTTTSPRDPRLVYVDAAGRPWGPAAQRDKGGEVDGLAGHAPRFRSPVVASGKPGGFPLSMFESFDTALAAARLSGKPLLVEFTAHQSLNARKLDAVLASPEVQRELERFETAALFTDAGTPDEDSNGKLEAERFGAKAVPACFVVGADGRFIARLESATSVEPFLAFLRSVK